MFNITLDELLSFNSELSTTEIELTVKNVEREFNTKPYSEAFNHARSIIEKYPSSDNLILNIATLMNYHGMKNPSDNTSEHEKYVLSLFKRLLNSSNNKVREAAAETLYYHYLNRGDNISAESMISLMPDTPERKRKKAKLYEKNGDKESAYRTYEEILFASYLTIDMCLNDLYSMCIESGNYDSAEYYSDKRCELIRLFERGKYEEYACKLELYQARRDREKTLECAKGMTENIESLFGFTESRLYAHMKFKSPDEDYIETVMKDIKTALKDKAFDYMTGNAEWERVIGE